MDELKLLPANAIVAAFREVAEKNRKKANGLQGKTGFQNFLLREVHNSGADMISGLADDIEKMDPVDEAVLRVALIQKIKNGQKGVQKLYWRDFAGNKVCPVCGYECNDDYYLDKFCPGCGTRLWFNEEEAEHDQPDM